MSTAILRLTAVAGAVLIGTSTGAAAAPKTAPHPPTVVGDAARGLALYQSKCAGCHSIDQNRIGPKHRGVVGRKAGSVPGYDYSPALRNSGVTWTPATLDPWLKAPIKYISGVRMGFSLADANDRADVIAYLATQK